MSSIIRISAIVLLLAAQTTILAEDAVRWAPDLDSAKRAASARNQLVLMHFYGDNCPPCRRIDANIFSQTSFAEAVEKDFVPVKINATRDPQLAQQFGVDRWPQDVVITPSGQVVYRMISPQDQQRYSGILGQVAAKMNGNAPAAGMVAQAGVTSPVSTQADPSVGAAGQATLPSPQQGSRYSSFTAGTQPQSSQAAAEATPSQPPVQPGPQPSTSRFASHHPAQGASPAAPTQSRFTSTGVDTPDHAAAPRSATASAPPGGNSSPNMPQNALAAQSQQNAPQQQAAPPQPQSAPQQQQQPKFAMDGYCPVTLMEQMKWQKGDPRWGAVHQGQVYLFSTQAEQQKFLADPNRFSPVMSGIDPVAYLGQGQVIPGDRRFGLTYRGTLYLFSSEESLQTFWNEPQRYSSMVQQAMASQNMRR